MNTKTKKEKTQFEAIVSVCEKRYDRGCAIQSESQTCVEICHYLDGIIKRFHFDKYLVHRVKDLHHAYSMKWVNA